MEFRQKSWLLWTIVALIGLVLLAFLLDWWPFLRGGYGWRWPYVAPTWNRLPRMLPALLVLILYVAGLRFLNRRAGKLFLLLVFVVSLLLPIALLYWWGEPLRQLFTRTISGLTTGGFAVATQITNWQETWSHWPDLMPGWESTSSHMAVSPPGWPLLYHAFMLGLARLPTLSNSAGMAVRPLVCDNVPLMNLSNAQFAASWLGIAAPLWVALTVFPMFAWLRSAAGTETAKVAIAWWPLVPSLAMFLGTLNSPYPLVATLIVWWLWSGLQAQSSWRGRGLLVLAGAVTAVAILFSFSFVPLLLFAALLAWVAGWRREGEAWSLAVKRPFHTGFFFALGLLLVFGLYTIALGHSPLDIWRSTTAYHFDLERPYFPWLWLHSWDFVIFFGLPAFSLFLLSLSDRRRGAGFQLSLSLALCLFIVVLSGTARGETGRIWSLFMPVALVGTAVTYTQLSLKFQRIFFSLQMGWLVGLFIVLPTTGSAIAAPPAYADIAFPPDPATVIPVAANFEDVLVLRGFQANGDAAEQAIRLNLIWEKPSPMAVPYFFSVIPVGPAGQVAAPFTWQPFDYQFPTTCWAQAAGPLVDQVEVPLGEAAATGDWWLSLTVFALPPGGEPQPLTVQTTAGTAETQIGLGPVSFSP